MDSKSIKIYYSKLTQFLCDKYVLNCFHTLDQRLGSKMLEAVVGHNPSNVPIRRSNNMEGLRNHFQLGKYSKTSALFKHFTMRLTLPKLKVSKSHQMEIRNCGWMKRPSTSRCEHNSTSSFKRNSQIQEPRTANKNSVQERRQTKTSGNSLVDMKITIAKKNQFHQKKPKLVHVTNKMKT